ncbi:MAG: hypothetical protein PF549_05125 [Patescibacteria group bacterium]|jgi:hypothetical protein|nr:hypothetical protein [Patescibacteria group bacterium]
MAEIIDFTQFLKKNDFEDADLNELLSRASLICQKKSGFPQGEADIVGIRDLRNVFDGEITQEIFRRKLVSSEIFLCGVYVSKLLTELSASTPESWWAIDYATKEESLANKRGGDICFIICSVFPDRGNYRSNNIGYYQHMGENFYFKFYGMAKKEIGYYMSRQFEVMTTVVHSCMEKIKVDNEDGKGIQP